MLVQGAVGGDTASRRPRVFERDFCLNDGLLIVDTGFKQTARQLQRLSISLDGAVLQILQSILPAELEVIRREVGLLRETLIFEIGCIHLGGILILVDRVTDAAP